MNEQVPEQKKEIRRWSFHAREIPSLKWMQRFKKKNGAPFLKTDFDEHVYGVHAVIQQAILANIRRNELAKLEEKRIAAIQEAEGTDDTVGRLQLRLDEINNKIEQQVTEIRAANARARKKRAGEDEQNSLRELKEERKLIYEGLKEAKKKARFEKEEIRDKIEVINMNHVEQRMLVYNNVKSMFSGTRMALENVIPALPKMKGYRPFVAKYWERAGSAFVHMGGNGVSMTDILAGKSNKIRIEFIDENTGTPVSRTPGSKTPPRVIAMVKIRLGSARITPDMQSRFVVSEENVQKMLAAGVVTEEMAEKLREMIGESNRTLGPAEFRKRVVAALATDAMKQVAAKLKEKAELTKEEVEAAASDTKELEAKSKAISEHAIVQYIEDEEDPFEARRKELKKKKKPTTHEAEELRKLDHRKAWHERDIYATFPMTVHREFPNDPSLMVKNVSIHFKPMAQKTEWEIQFSLERNSWKEPREKTGVVVAMNPGWRLIDGDLRVCKWVDSDGKTGELRIPAKALAKWTKREDLRHTIDSNYNAMIGQLDMWLKAKPEIPEWLMKTVTDKNDDRIIVSMWKSKQKMRRLVLRWRDNRFPGDEWIFGILQQWRAQHDHLWEWEANNGERGADLRKDLYNCFAKEMAASYDTVIFDDTDRKLLARRLPANSNDPDIMAQRQQMRIAATGLLVAKVTNAFASAAPIPPANITVTCHHCGSNESADMDPSKVMHECQACGAKYDIDENACMNLLKAFRESEKS